MFIDKEKYERQRKKKGLTATHLINNCGVNRNEFYNYVNGKKEAPSDFILRLANELVCPVIYLKK